MRSQNLLTKIHLLVPRYMDMLVLEGWYKVKTAKTILKPRWTFLPHARTGNPHFCLGTAITYEATCKSILQLWNSKLLIWDITWNFEITREYIYQDWCSNGVRRPKQNRHFLFFVQKIHNFHASFNANQCANFGHSTELNDSKAEINGKTQHKKQT